MNPVIKTLINKHERIKNLYDIGPVQRAEIEQFIEDILHIVSVDYNSEDFNDFLCKKGYIDYVEPRPN